MARFEIVLLVQAPPEVCFDAARDIDLHVQTMAHTGERAVAGTTSGLIGPGESVTWRARHLGVTQELTSKIAAFDHPRHFRDEMVRGAFAWFKHDHFFEEAEGGATLMRETFEFASPFGIVGRLFDWIFLAGYMERLLRQRCEVVKNAAEERARRPSKP